MGVLYFFTGALCGIGWLVDACLIPSMVDDCNHRNDPKVIVVNSPSQNVNNNIIQITAPPATPQFYPPPQGYPPQGYPPQGYPPQGYGYPPPSPGQAYPPQGPGPASPPGYPPTQGGGYPSYVPADAASMGMPPKV